MKKIRLFLIIIAILVLGNVVLQAAQEPVTIRITLWASDEGLKLEQSIIDLFEKMNPDIKVKVIFIPWGNYNEKLLTMVVGGIAPDVMWVMQDKLAYFASRNVMVDLGPLLTKDPEWPEMQRQIYPGSLGFCSWNNKQFGLARDVCTWFIAYNKDLFDKAGVPYPKEEWTWDDYLKISEKLTKKDAKGQYIQFGSWWVHPVEVMFSQGAYYFDPVTHEATITAPEFCEAMQYCADLAKKYHVAPKGFEQSAFGGDLFQSQRVAMNFAGPWMFSTYKKNCQFRWDIMTLPKGKAGHRQTYMGLPISISVQTKHLEASYRLLKFLCWSREAQSLQAQIGLATPTRKDICRSPVFMKQPSAPPRMDLYIKSLEQYAVPQIYTINWMELMSVYDPQYQLLALDETKEDACTIFQKILPKFKRKLAKAWR